MGDGSEVAVVLRFVGGGHDAIYDVGGSGVEGVKGVEGIHTLVDVENEGGRALLLSAQVWQGWSFASLPEQHPA